MPKKTWKEKLEDAKSFPKVLELEEGFPCWLALRKMGASVGDTVVLAPGIDVYEMMKQIPEGKLQTLEILCKRLASKYGVGYCCTLTTGIFVNIVANASVEVGESLPYWRTIKNDGSLNPKYPGGAENHKLMLEKEGFTVLQKGRKSKKYLVEDFRKFLVY
jgi:alkylated DNA nucleotide flippase Atl1